MTCPSNFMSTGETRVFFSCASAAFHCGLFKVKCRRTACSYFCMSLYKQQCPIFSRKLAYFQAENEFLSEITCLEAEPPGINHIWAKIRPFQWHVSAMFFFTCHFFSYASLQRFAHAHRRIGVQFQHIMLHYVSQNCQLNSCENGKKRWTISSPCSAVKTPLSRTLKSQSVPLMFF